MQNVKDLYNTLPDVHLSNNRNFYRVVHYSRASERSCTMSLSERSFTASWGNQNELGRYGAIVTRSIGSFITSRQVRRSILIELKGFDQQTTILLENISEAAKDRAYQVDQTRVQINTRMILTWSQRTIRQTKTLTRTNERNKRNWLRPPIQSFLDCVISWSC